MGFWDFLSRGNVPQAVFSPRVEYVGGPAWGGENPHYFGHDVRHWSAAQMWRTQPHLRTVVSFLARNVAQLGLQTFERVGETDRQRDRTSPIAVALKRPDTSMTAYDLVFSLVGDMSLYDTAYWLVSTKPDGTYGFRRLPPAWVSEVRDNPFEVAKYRISQNNNTVDVSPDQILAFSGYAPHSPAAVSPTIASLKETLQEQLEASKFRNQVWKRGGRVSAVLQRPSDAPAWSPEAREQFREDWYAKYTGNGPKAGGTPILEDGMTLNRIDFSAKDQEFVEGAKLSFATVAAAFHVNPTMVGILDNANYSNVREFRRMLYGDTLGPLLAQIEDRINTFLLPMLGMDPDRFYCEFNIAEKLQGSFEEQAGTISTLVGRPIFTANEGRALFNKPAMEGGDALVTPLNVLVGGQASPTDSGTQNEKPKVAAVPATKGFQKAVTAPESHERKIREVLDAFFARQGRTVLSALGAGRDWWDAERWNGELAADLHRVTHTLADILGPAQAARLGYPDDWNSDRTVNFLKAVAERKAATINETTQRQVQRASEDSNADPADVFSDDARTVGIAAGLSAWVSGFSNVEAARHVATAQNVKPTKTWVTGENPRREHAAINGETVDIDAKFSNGMDWPGSGGGPDDAGCNCSVITEIP